MAGDRRLYIKPDIADHIKLSVADIARNSSFKPDEQHYGTLLSEEHATHTIFKISMDNCII